MKSHMKENPRVLQEKLIRCGKERLGQDNSERLEKFKSGLENVARFVIIAKIFTEYQKLKEE